MSLDQVCSLCEEGMEIGSHSMTHAWLSELNDSQITHEIFGSKTYLEESLGKAVRTFAYPFGAYRSFNGKTRTALQSAGYEGACVNLLGWNRPGDDPFTLRRTRIGWDDGPWRFFLKVFGAYDWIDGYWIRLLSGRLKSRVQTECIP
jgi:peptidoglycan/xylan/chitin deacetylase (PgdA/CDA1 family)